MMQLQLREELFSFVMTPSVEMPNGKTVEASGTNNEAERTLRTPATARDTGRTTKTPTGARRRTIHASVLESLRCYLGNFTLSAVIEEVQQWFDTGVSCFSREMAKLNLPPPTRSVLAALFPPPIPQIG